MLKRALLFGMLFSLTCLIGCANLKKQDQNQPITHKPADVGFMCYKTTIKVKATPDQVEQYILFPKNVTMRSPLHSFIISSDRKLEHPGEMVEFEEIILGVPEGGRFILAYYDPGKEVWYLSDLNEGGISLMRIEYQRIGDSTRVTIKYELERERSAATFLDDLINVQGMMAKLIDQEIVSIQKHFDPEVNSEEILAKGRIGEFYEAFYQGQELSVQVNRPLGKTISYLTDPRTWQTWKENFGYDFAQCLAKPESGRCEVHLKMFGGEKTIDSFAGRSKPGEYATAFWVDYPIFARVKVILKPCSAGTRITVQYMVEVPFIMSEVGPDLIANILSLPQILDQFLLSIKNDIEKS